MEVNDECIRKALTFVAQLHINKDWSARNAALHVLECIGVSERDFNMAVGIRVLELEDFKKYGNTNPLYLELAGFINL